MNRIAWVGLLTWGCGGIQEDQSAPGSISLSWTIGSQGCTESGVVDVAVLADGIELGVLDCDAGSGQISDVPPGTYTIEVVGRVVEGLDRYGTEVPNVVIRSGADTPLGNVTLSALPAQLTVSWVFGDGGLCTQNDVETIHVRMFDSGDFLGHEAEGPCNDGELVLTDINGGEWSVQADGLNTASQVTRSGSSDVTVEAGIPTEVEVTLVTLGLP